MIRYSHRLSVSSRGYRYLVNGENQILKFELSGLACDKEVVVHFKYPEAILFIISATAKPSILLLQLFGRLDPGKWPAAFRRSSSARSTPFFVTP